METYDPHVRRELVDLAYDSIPFSIIVNILAALTVTAVYWPKTGKNAALWFGLIIAAMLYRLAVYIYHKSKEDQIPVARAEVLLTLGLILSGMAWVSGLWYFLGRQGASYDFFLTFVMGGMASGAITTLSSVRVTAVSYIGILLGGTALWLFVSPEPLEKMMAALVVIYMAFLINSSGRVSRTIADSFTLRRENTQWIRALKAHRAEIELVFDNVPVGILFYDKNFKIVNINQKFLQIFKTERDQIIGMDLEEVKDRRIVPALRAPIDYNGLEDGYYEGPYHTTRSDTEVEIRLKTTALKDSKNRLVGAIGIVEDIAKELEQKRQIESFAQFYIQNPNPVMQIDCESKEIVIENDAARAIHVGLRTNQPVRWKRFLQRVCEGDEKSVDLKYGEEVYQFDVVSLDIHRINLYGRNVTKERIARERADYLAYYDELTGLPRRKLLLEHVKIAMLRAERNDTTNALLFLDLDNFKQINDSMGHDVGDYLLVQLAKRLTELMRTGDIVARLGGDEFVVLLSDIKGDREEAALKSEIVAKKICEEIARPFSIKGRKLHFSVSIGITLFKHGRDFFDLLKEADVAMYEAKSSGKNSIKLFDSQLEKSTVDKTELLQDIHNAIEKNQLTILYQPQVEIATARCVGAEALLRWEHPRKGLISPEIFIPLAEESGAIHELGQWVLRQVSRQTRELPLEYIAVNISIKEFVRSDFIEMVKEMAAAGEIDPSRIELEMTESVFIENFRTINEKLRELREMGFRFSIDDFGTGYSSLAYLKNLSIKTLKIDKGFIEDIGINPNDEVLTRTIIDIASHFDMKTVAEGVENETQLTFLKNFGCDIVQGYYFGKPMSIEAFQQWMQERTDHGICHV
ncbi:EAL domain-containing protein [Hydrogenimonas sp. SS33]|uniref:sensor domain-containing protein n=1 Tax=Hydrogenimonas leucolamina TaxID=2954236 RepID=UPI00336C2845